MRAATWNNPRFLHSYDETLDGGLILPRSMLDTVTSLAAQAGSRLDVTDERTPGTQQEATFTATLTSVQDAAVTDLARHDLGVLVAPPRAASGRSHAMAISDANRSAAPAHRTPASVAQPPRSSGPTAYCCLLPGSAVSRPSGGIGMSPHAARAGYKHEQFIERVAST
jgi:hypothetical protein